MKFIEQFSRKLFQTISQARQVLAMAATPQKKSDTDWESRWEKGQTQWHRSVVNERLIKHHDRLREGANVGEKPLNVFVPLCGKSVDMMWLYEQGHHVTGVELVRKGLDEFVAEQKLPSTESSVSNSDGEAVPVIRAGEDGRISLFASDLFKLDSGVLNTVDAVWDRGSYVALDSSLRERYAAFVATLVKPGGRILMETIDYVQSEHTGPPFSVSREEMQSRFGESFSIELLETIDIFGHFQERFPTIKTRAEINLTLLVRNSA